MGVQIENGGRGGSFKAEVTDEGQVKIRGAVHTEEHHISFNDGQSYFVNTATTNNTLSIANGETINMLYISNSSPSLAMIIQEITVSVDVDDPVLILYKNSTLGSVGANNVETPVNLNFGSNHSASGVFHSWDESGTAGITGITLGTKIDTYVLSLGTLDLDLGGAFILGQGNNLVLVVTNPSGAASATCCGVRFFYDDI